MILAKNPMKLVKKEENNELQSLLSLFIVLRVAFPGSKCFKLTIISLHIFHTYTYKKTNINALLIG